MTAKKESTPETPILRDSDKQILLNFFAPDYILPAATRYGNGDPVLGALDAYRESRNATRDYIRFVRFRDGKTRHDLSLAQSLRALGWVGSFQKVSPFDQDRSTAFAAWKDSPTQTIPGWVEVEVGGAPQDVAQRAAVRVISRLFVEHPELNRAILDGRVWRRHSPEILVNLKIDDGFPRSVTIDPSAWDDAEHKRQMFRLLRKLLRVEKHELRPFATELLNAWTEVGFIASPGSAMVSCTNVPAGWGTLYPANGIPIVFNVCRVKNGLMKVCVTPSHLAFDGNEMEIVYDYLEREVAEEIRRAK